MNDIVSKTLVSIIFDDGMLSIYDVVFPLFEKYNIAGNIAFVGSYLNKRGYLTAEKIKDILRGGWSLGDHTFTHPDMNCINPKMLSEEIKRNKMFVKHLFNYELRYFVFPRSNVKVHHLPIIFSNYRFAFSGSSKIVSNTPPFNGLLNRTEISIYEMLRFFIRGQNFFKRIIQQISSVIPSDTYRWFVLFTHDVNKIPSFFGTPKICFDWLIKELLKMKVQIVSVNSVLFEV
jgi:peptidoglycan/xylan/chitin deacetylase (PgdA/CDA1 family)